MALPDVTERFETVAAPGLAARVDSFRLEEAIGEPYLLEVDLDVAAAELDPAELLGRDAVFFLERLPLLRRVAGVIRTVREGRRYAAGGAFVHVEVVPALWMLSLRRDTRMFQERTVPQILEAVLGAGLAPYGRQIRADLDATYPRREYCLQYQESDLAFVHRLMEEEGIHYAFEQEGAVELMVLRDRNGLAEPVPAAPADGVATYQPHALATAETEPIHRFARTHSSVTTAVALRDRDWTGGRIVVEDGRAGVDARGRTRESYEHGEGRSLTIGGYAGRRYQANDRSRQAELRLEAHGARARVGAGIGRVIGFTAGARFSLVGHPDVGLDDDYLITRVVHSSEPSEELRELGGTERYHNTFECTPMSVPHRPARRTPKPRIMSMQTAVVTGPAGEEIHCDEWGRVKVRFHWDRENPPNDTSSAWIRVRQEWTGPGWGSLWIPRMGVEVIVQFVDGDPDRPVVTGCLYDGDNPPPYDLPREKTKSTIKSNSSLGGGGFNEIRFEDAAGAEEVFVHSQKDTNAITLDCETNSVGVDQTIAIGANQTQTVGANQTELVGVDQAMTVGANRVVTVGASFTETIGGTSTITVSGHATETLNAGETQTLTGGRTETVNGGETRTVDGGQTETITGGLEQTITGGVTQSITGAVAETFDGAHTNTTTGSLTHTILGGATVSTPAAFNLIALGGYNLLAPAGGTITAAGGWQVIAAAGQTWIESAVDKLTSVDIKVGAMNGPSVKGVSRSVTGLSASFTAISLSAGGAKIAPEALKVYGNGPEITVAGMHLTIAGVTVAISAVRLLG